jgi:putative transcriptional regulator
MERIRNARLSSGVSMVELPSCWAWTQPAFFSSSYNLFPGNSSVMVYNQDNRTCTGEDGMAQQMSLSNQLLIATPSVQSPEFAHTVVYVCEHHEQGTVGLIINRPLKYSLGIVFEQLKIEPLHAEKSKMPLMFGGPVQPERGFVIHRPLGHWHSSLALVPDDVTITTSNDIIRAIAIDKGPRDVLVTLGYVAWIENQLEDEIINKNAWLVCPLDLDLLYNIPFERRWEAAGLSIGVDMKSLTTGEGHA